MCGIAGYTGPIIPGVLERMIRAIRHRGPDGEGTYSDTEHEVHFGHARLAILDLAGGTQPMVREDGRVAVTYNGEIYNYPALRERIERTGRHFTTTCDTELLPLGYAAFGPKFFAELNGIFAFALFDKGTRRLFLVRDHFGVKPLYYAEIPGGIAFASCAQALLAHAAVDRGLNAEAVRQYLQYRYVPDGSHFMRGVHTLPPGTILEIEGQTPPRKHAYWSPAKRVGARHRDAGEWVERTLALLELVVHDQLQSDVPVGLFLSGGVNSSLLAYLSPQHAPYTITAYTFGMRDAADETTQAAATAAATGIRHEVITFDRTDDFSGLYDAVACMDLPVGDAIILPTYELCRAAARDVKVVLTGEGADEVFGGYVHFKAFEKFRRLARILPFANRLAPLVNALPVAFLNRFFDYQASLGVLGRQKLARMVADLHRPESIYRSACSVIDDRDITRAAELGAPPAADDMDLGLSNVMLETVRTWLPYQILNKMDQLSMAHGLEARVPYLDPRLYDHMASAPDELVLAGGANKVLLRKALDQLGGDWARPKLAFHVPMERRYRTALENLCKAWLSPSVTKRYGILRQPFIDENLEHLRYGDFLASKRLMTMICLHMWLDAHGTID